jgi:hypothetical protein
MDTRKLDTRRRVGLMGPVGKRGPKPAEGTPRRKVIGVAVTATDYDAIRTLLAPRETVSSWAYTAVKARIDRETRRKKRD